MSKLTGKQRAFINHYIVTLNATESARLAGYQGTRDTLRAVGAENLAKPSIKAEVERRMEKFAMPSYEVLKRLTDMARADITDYLTEDGGIDIDAMKAAGAGHLLKKYKRIKRTLTAKGIPIGEEEYLETEMYPADGALDKLMRYHSLYNDKIKVETWQDKVIDALRQGKLKPELVRQRWGDELASQFFRQAGVNVESAR